MKRAEAAQLLRSLIERVEVRYPEDAPKRNATPQIQPTGRWPKPWTLPPPPAAAANQARDCW